MEFEWDVAKNNVNLRKHDIDFQQAVKIFDGPTNRGIDEKGEYGETREWAVGEANGRMIYLVFTIRGDRCRIISARKVNRRERRDYLRALYSGESS